MEIKDMQAFYAVVQEGNISQGAGRRRRCGGRGRTLEMIIGKAQSHEAFVLIDEAYLYFAPTTFIDYVCFSGHT